MNYLKLMLISLTSLLLLACSPDNSPKPKLFEEQRNALDQAKAVNKAAEQQAKDLQQNVDKQTQ